MRQDPPAGTRHKDETSGMKHQPPKTFENVSRRREAANKIRVDHCLPMEHVPYRAGSVAAGWMVAGWVAGDCSNSINADAYALTTGSVSSLAGLVASCLRNSAGRNRPATKPSRRLSQELDCSISPMICSSFWPAVRVARV